MARRADLRRTHHITIRRGRFSQITHSVGAFPQQITEEAVVLVLGHPPQLRAEALDIGFEVRPLDPTWPVMQRVQLMAG